MNDDTTPTELHVSSKIEDVARDIIASEPQPIPQPPDDTPIGHHRNFPVAGDRPPQGDHQDPYPRKA